MALGAWAANLLVLALLTMRLTSRSRLRLAAAAPFSLLQTSRFWTQRRQMDLLVLLEAVRSFLPMFSLPRLRPREQKEFVVLPSPRTWRVTRRSSTEPVLLSAVLAVALADVHCSNSTTTMKTR